MSPRLQGRVPLAPLEFQARAQVVGVRTAAYVPELSMRDVSMSTSNRRLRSSRVPVSVGPEWSDVVFAEFLGVTTKSLRRWRVGGVPSVTADRLACRLGLHPVLLWPEWEDVA